MKSRGQNYKISQVIALSSNYKLHRIKLDTMKPAIDMSTDKRKHKIDKLKNEKLKYRQAVRDFTKVETTRQNDRLVKRIQDAYKKRERQTAEKMSRIRNLDESRISSRSSKNLKSISSSKSFTSVSSNYRQRLKRQKQIMRENTKIAGRIVNPKTVRTLAISQLKRSYQKQQEHVRTRSRFSQKNQQIVRSLALQGLKFDRKDVQYLPQLTHKKGKNLSKQKSLSRLSSTSRLN